MTSSSLAEAFAANRGALLRYLRARGAGDDAEDILQDLWLKTSIEDQSAIFDPLAFLYRMAHNLMLDTRRSEARRRQRHEAFHERFFGDPGGEHAPATDGILAARDELRHVDRALAALGTRTDFIFRRYRVEGFSQKDIAAELGISLSAVEKHLQKAYRAVAAAHRTLMAEGVSPAGSEGSAP